MLNQELGIPTIFAGALLATFGIAQAHAAPAPVRYACSESANFSVQRDGTTAKVSLAGHIYDLQRKRSSIGAKYTSSNAALILDGETAVFVEEHHLDLGNCVRARSVASAAEG